MRKRLVWALVSAISCMSAFAQEQSEVLDDVEDVLEVTEGYPVSSGTDFKSALIGILIFLAFAWMIGHMIYVLWIRKNPFAPISIEEMKVMRTAENAPSEMSEEEYEACRDIIVDMHDSWTDLPNEDAKIVTTRSQMKQAEEGIAQIRDMKPTDPELIDIINEHLEVLNEAQKREFTGSKTLMVLLVLVAAFVIWQTGWSALPLFIFNAVTYVLASLTPTFMIYRRELNGNNGAGCLSAILGGAAAMILGAQTVTTVTKWSDGTTTREDDNSQHFIAWILAIIIAVVLTFLMFVWAAVNYLRNYVFYR